MCEKWVSEEAWSGLSTWMTSGRQTPSGRCCLGTRPREHLDLDAFSQPNSSWEMWSRHSTQRINMVQAPHIKNKLLVRVMVQGVKLENQLLIRGTVQALYPENQLLGIGMLQALVSTQTTVGNSTPQRRHVMVKALDLDNFTQVTLWGKPIT